MTAITLQAQANSLPPVPQAAPASAVLPAALSALDALITCWKTSPYPSFKISSYFPAYAELFAHLRGTACTFVETGILDGGSLFMWRHWLGPRARIVGIDLNPAAAQWRDHGFEIHIGDQGDPAFWRKTLAEIGPFDALLDDGGHQFFQQIVTANEAIGAARHKCIVAVEDTATSFMRDFLVHGKDHTFLEYAKDATDLLVGRSFQTYPGRLPADFNRAVVNHFRDVFSVQFFSGIVAFKIDPSACYAPQQVRNMGPNAATDFRYEGLDAALVDWPDVLQARQVRVQGGQGEQGG